MATFHVVERADEYRIEIVGKFAGSCVHEVTATWKRALQANLERRITVDISRLSEYDHAGRTALRQMHKHGTVIAAPNADSLMFLEEITSLRRSPAVLREANSAKPQQSAGNYQGKAAASGE